MSLQVWLPLNGDLHNQGLDNTINITNTGATINNIGKIGQCYEFAASKKLSTPINIEKLNSNSISFAYWIYINSWGSSYDTIMSIASGTSWNNSRAVLCRNNTASTLTWNIGNNSTSKRVNTNTSITLNTWTHIAATYDGQNLKIYLNGILDNTTTANLGIIYSNTLVIGAWTTNNNYPFNGKINDVRIYDHALSAKEVEEIAKGLVLHYKLDNNGLGNPNLVKGNYSAITTATTNNVSGTLSFDTSIISLNDLKGKTLYFSYDYSVEGAKLYNNTGDYTKDRYGIHGNLSYVDSSGTTKTVYPFAGYLTASGTGRAIQSYIVPADARQINSLTFGLQPFNKPAANSTATWYIKNCKLEIGRATSYTPNQNDIHQNSSIIYDSSGYNNNGTIVGSLQAITPSPRYSCMTHFDGNTACIKTPYNEINPDRIFTINLWFYKDALGSKGYETLFGGPSGFEMDTRSGSSSTLSLYMASVRGGNVYSPLSLNKWTMITMVRDGTNEFYYVDGDLKKTIEAKTMPSGQYRIGAWNSDTGQNYYGNISDFRIYATALTAAQIKELYKTSMIVNGASMAARDLE